MLLIFNTRGNTNAKLDSNSVDQKQQNSCDKTRDMDVNLLAILLSLQVLSGMSVKIVQVKKIRSINKYCNICRFPFLALSRSARRTLSSTATITSRRRRLPSWRSSGISTKTQLHSSSGSRDYRIARNWNKLFSQESKKVLIIFFSSIIIRKKLFEYVFLASNYWRSVQGQN